VCVRARKSACCCTCACACWCAGLETLTLKTKSLPYADTQKVSLPASLGGRETAEDGPTRGGDAHERSALDFLRSGSSDTSKDSSLPPAPPRWSAAGAGDEARDDE